MKLWKITEHETDETGTIVNTVEKIVKARTGANAEMVLDGIGRLMQAQSWSIYWAFEEKSFKAVHNSEAPGILDRFVKVEPF